MIEKIKDWLCGIAMLAMMVYGMIKTAIKGEIEEDDSDY